MSKKLKKLIEKEVKPLYESLPKEVKNNINTMTDEEWQDYLTKKK